MDVLTILKIFQIKSAAGFCNEDDDVVLMWSLFEAPSPLALLRVVLLRVVLRGG